ncbi:DUF2292 domain-containing protein [Streptococcus pluranimalium]|nr:DUF2292 domain-containing protein [Streptococcus pluranimalium]
MQLKEGLIYFSQNGKIEVRELPKFGEVTLKIQDGKIIHVRKIEDERVNHAD